MSDAEQLSLSLLVGDIYDTTLDLARWTEVLEKITGYMRGTPPGLSQKNLETEPLASINSEGRTSAAAYKWDNTGD
jgi:hypothetical protein